MANNCLEVLSEEEVFRVAKSCFSENFQILKYDLKAKEGKLGHLGDYFTLAIRAKVGDREVGRRCFIKLHLGTNDMSDYLTKSGIFQKEVDLYKILLSNLQKIADEQNLNVWPKCYFGKAKVLVMEDLSAEGFAVSRKEDFLDEEHLKVVLQTLSSFHALTIVYEQREEKTLLQLYPDLMEDLLYDENRTDLPSRKWLATIMKDLLVAVDYLDGYTAEERLLIKVELPKVLMKIFPLSSVSQRFKNVLVHGDLWVNNILFKHSDRTPVDCRLVDYQFTKYVPPAHDLMHLLHLTTSREFRQENGFRLCEFYYQQLKCKLEDYGYDIRKIITWESFKESCEHYKLLALIQSVLGLHYVFAPRVPFDDENRDEMRNEYMKKYFEDKLYASRLSDVLMSLIDNYILSDNCLN